MSAELLADLARVKVVFQLRALTAIMGLRDSVGDRNGENSRSEVECEASQSGAVKLAHRQTLSNKDHQS